MVEVQTPGLVQHLVILFIFSLPFFTFAFVIILLFKILISKSSHLYMKRTAGVFLIAIFSLIIVFQSLYISKTINDPRELNNIVCGSPLPYVTFHSYRALPDHAWTRSCIGWMGNPMETPKTFLWGNFFINVAIVFGVIWGGIYFARKVYRLRKQ